MSKLLKYKKTIFSFIIPIILGIIIGKLAYITDEEIVIRTLITISDNIVVILKFLAPFLVLTFCATALYEIKESTKEKIFYLGRLFRIIFITLLPLTLIVFFIGLTIVPILSFNIVDGSSPFVNPLFKIGLKPPIGEFQGIIIGIILGLLLKEKSIIMKIIYKIQYIILIVFKYVITPIMPFWILASFSLTAYSGSSAPFFLTDILLSILILITQFTWLSSMFYIVSKKIKTSFKKVLNAGLRVYGYAVSLSGNGGVIIFPFILKEQKKLKQNEQKAKLVTATSFNMPGSLISNIIFIMGIVYMTNFEIGIFVLFKLFFVIMLLTIVAPAIPGGTASIVGGVLPNYGFSATQVSLYQSMYYKQGISNAATNNAADIYITPYI